MGIIHHQDTVPGKPAEQLPNRPWVFKASYTVGKYHGRVLAIPSRLVFEVPHKGIPSRLPGRTRRQQGLVAIWAKEAAISLSDKVFHKQPCRKETGG
jgi:hypothetical protein